jgi:hypothetical protein
MHRSRPLSLALALCGFALAGCGTVSPATSAATQSESGPIVPATQSIPAAIGTTAPSVVLAPTPTLRSGQEATDPATVNLASGKPTLVKFFAFW